MSRPPVQVTRALLVASLLALGGAGEARAQAGETATAARRVVFDEPSPHGRVLVVEERGLRYLRFGSVRAANQSAFDPARPQALPLEYVRFSLLPAAAVAEPRRILMVGLGGGSFTRAFHARLAETIIDVVEVNPVVVRAAREWFGVDAGPRFRVHVDDGRRFIERSEGRYDVVLLDAYGAGGIPESLQDEPFFSLVRARLAPRGVLIANLAVTDEEEAVLVERMRKVLGPLSCWRTPEHGNLIVAARMAAPMPSDEALRAVARALGERLALDFDLAALAGQHGKDLPAACR